MGHRMGRQIVTYLYHSIITCFLVVQTSHSLNSAPSDLQERLQQIIASNPVLHGLADQTAKDSPYPASSLAGQLWIEQAYINAPLLSIAATIIHQKANGQPIAFVTRDCVHLQKIYEIMYPNDHTLRFALSRIASYNPSASFLEYAKGILQRHPLIVDIHGSGASLQYLGTQVGIQPLLFNLFATSNELASIAQTQRGVWIEMLNRDLCGTLYDYVDGVELRHPIEYSRDLAAIQHEAIKVFIGHLKKQARVISADHRLFKQIAAAAESITLASTRYLGWQALHINRPPASYNQEHSLFRDPSLEKGQRLIQKVKPNTNQKRVSSERRRNRQPGPPRPGRGRL